MEDAEITKSVSSPLQRRLSLLILALLVLISGSMWWIQSRYDPAAWRAQQASSTSGPKEGQTDLPQGLVPLSPSEQYDQVNLSDKINGKAELYLGAGFKRLTSRRFALSADKPQWMERYVYGMTGHKNAFAVFSAQRRKSVETLDITSHAYLSANGLFFVHGSYYLEIIASDTSPVMQSKMKALASAFVQAHPASPQELSELDLFGTEDNVPNTTQLIAGSAFGIQNMDWIYTSTYGDGQDEATAFISKRSSAAEAASMAEAFLTNWKTFDGETVPTPDSAGAAGARIVLILDAYEIAVVQGRYFFGVHEATSLEFGLEVIARIRRSIESAGQEDET